MQGFRDAVGKVFFLNELAAVFRADFVGNVHGRVHILDPLNESVCFFGVVFALDTDAVCKAGKFLMRALSVRFENVGKDNRCLLYTSPSPRD